MEAAIFVSIFVALLVAVFLPLVLSESGGKQWRIRRVSAVSPTLR
jgi:hypothetical protein